MSTARFRKRPVVVEAICWNGQNLGSVQAFASGALGIGTVEGGALPLWVVKSSATCRVEQGDWIIREPDGSGYYPCAADVFAATYEPAEASVAPAPGSGTDDTGRVSLAAEANAGPRPGAVPALPVAAVLSEDIRIRLARAMYDSLDYCALRCKVCEHQIGAAAKVMAEAVSAERERAEAAEARLAELENAVTWNTSCTSCARVLDRSVADYERAEKAEGKLARITGACRSIPSPIAKRLLAITGSDEED